MCWVSEGGVWEVCDGKMGEGWTRWMGSLRIGIWGRMRGEHRGSDCMRNRLMASISIWFFRQFITLFPWTTLLTILADW